MQNPNYKSLWKGMKFSIFKLRFSSGQENLASPPFPYGGRDGAKLSSHVSVSLLASCTGQTCSPCDPVQDASLYASINRRGSDPVQDGEE